MTFLPLASQIQYRAMAQGFDHFVEIKTQESAGLNEGNAAEIHPVVEGTSGDIKVLREFLYVNQSCVIRGAPYHDDPVGLWRRDVTAVGRRFRTFG